MKISQETMTTVREIAQKVAAVDIPITRIKSQLRFPGERRCVFRGEGDDFDGHDLYTPGDDTRTIDWNATALTGGQQVLVALYKQDSHLPSTVLVDVSSTMDFGTERATKRILAAELAACAVKSLARSHDPVGLITYSSTGVERHLKASSAQSMLLPTILHTLESKETSREGKNSGLAKGLVHVSRSPSIVFVVSDFLNMTEADWKALKKVGLRHQVFAMYVQDIRERELPKAGLLPYSYPVQDSSGNMQDVWVTRGSRRKHHNRFLAHEAEILERLKQCHARSIVVSTNQGKEAIPGVLSFLSFPVR